MFQYIWKINFRLCSKHFSFSAHEPSFPSTKDLHGSERRSAANRRCNRFSFIFSSGMKNIKFQIVERLKNYKTITKQS